ncbi:hypothetical protein GCM10010954_10730 [Halobacillus andaensis]|uniref:Uncharacterized protein n=1 Tax=Halobacillus andaensis TaxID=1176239 RepID=A0A917B1H7_HALAA|nr:hypothetical protein [Halobacillus andaensis]MBP2003864.1 CRISPR/Cas system CMR-associated protein Cmr1 (group 7 of RAMP superfamily) [Halobacillus andaensis]GGF13829.1 hypothetical protein GCM10010954_10730 [Halobacillus andaensis]
MNRKEDNMTFKLIAHDSNRTMVEFAKNNEELVFGSYEEAAEFASKIKDENRWAAVYEFSIIESE